MCSTLALCKNIAPSKASSRYMMLLKTAQRSYLVWVVSKRTNFWMNPRPMRSSRSKLEHQNWKWRSAFTIKIKEKDPKKSIHLKIWRLMSGMIENKIKDRSVGHLWIEYLGSDLVACLAKDLIPLVAEEIWVLDLNSKVLLWPDLPPRLISAMNL